jgi:uncharacterized protein (DUF433 family)
VALSTQFIEQLLDDWNEMTPDDLAQIVDYAFKNATAHESRTIIINMRRVSDDLAKRMK